MEALLSPCMYTVVCSQPTQKDWSRCHKALVEKYEGKWPGRVRQVTFVNGDVSSALRELSELKSTYTCFLVHHSECHKNFIQEVHKLTREIDPSTSYTDTIWGVLTGWEEEDCLQMLKHDSLTVERVTGNCPIPLENFTSGVLYSELEQSTAWRKTNNGELIQESCPPDVTETFILEIGTCRSADKGVDMIITSAHATQNELNLGYYFKSGQVRCTDGHIQGVSLDGQVHMLNRQDDTPRIMSAAGNCLMGLISDQDSMALAWIHSAGVVQMVGYVVPTWYGYGGWGVHKYFINNPGRMTFSEAYFANQQSLLAKLESLQAPKPAIENHEDMYKEKFGVKNISDVNLHDLSGLSYDQDTTVFYGDPAWEARLSPKQELWDYSLTVTAFKPSEGGEDGWNYWELIVTTLRAGRWDCPSADDKTISPGRPPLYVFPARVSNAKLLAGDAIVTCNFVLILLQGSFNTGEIHKVQFAIII